MWQGNATHARLNEQNERTMHERQIHPAAPVAELHDGFPDAIDRLAERSALPRSFLRMSWYRAGAQGSGQTLIGKNAQGGLIAAIPTMRAKPGILGIRSVPGCYWPFRSVLLADDVLVEELAELLAQDLAIKALGSVWRMGPVPVQDATSRLVMRAAALAGWSVLERSVGRSWIFDLGNGNGLPGKSTAKRLKQYGRRLAQQGQPSWRTVSGSGWDEATLEQLGQIERQSWVGRKTDGSGAKFLYPSQRALWRDALTDPHIADMVQATVLSLDDRPIAFSLDMICGSTQYAIACSFVEDMGRYRLGNLVTFHQLQRAREHSVTIVDLGSGDLGYKRQMGASEGDELVDLLFVRSRLKAGLLALKWGAEPDDLKRIRQVGLAANSQNPGQ